MTDTLAKCPACGALRTSFTAFCPDCGYEFREVQSSQSLKEFTDKIESYDREIAYSSGETPGANIGKFLLWLFFFPYMLAYYFFKKIQSKNGELNGVEKLKAETIINYPIPNSRNDLLEFAFLIENHVRPVSIFESLSSSGGKTQRWNKVWLRKAAQLNKKAMIALNGDRTTLNHIQETISRMEKQYNRNNKYFWIAVGALGLLFILFILMLSLSN